MGTMYNVIAKEIFLERHANFRVWRDTIQNVYEKEDIWDLLEPEEKDLEDDRELGVIDEGPYRSKNFVNTPAERQLL